MQRSAVVVGRPILIVLLALAPSLGAGELPAWKQRLQPGTDAWTRAEQHFIFNNGTEPEGLDPARITGVSEGRLADALFEGLVTLDPETLAPRPGVAQSWTVSADGQTYTFQLRKNARWTNGDPVTARDFLRSWKRVLTPKTASEYAYQLYYVAGAEDFHRKKTEDFSTVGVSVQDAHTLEVRLRAPCAYFLELCAFHTLLPVPVDVVEAHGDRWTRPEHIVGNGAFQLAAWKPREKIVLVQSSTYWDRDFVKLDKVTVLPYEDQNTAYKLFLEGQVHWLSAVPQAKIEEVKRHPDYYVTPYLGTYYYRFNVTRPPFDDVRVRKAFCRAVDRSVITDHVLKSGQKPSTWFCPSMGAYEPPAGLGYDRDAAKRLLAEAGYGPGGKPFPEVELFFNTSEAHKKVAEAIVQQWNKHLGVTVSLRNTEWKVYLDKVRKLDYAIARAGWIGDYSDPNTFLDMFVTGGGNNNTGWSNARYDDLIGRAQRELDPKKRLAAFREAETILVRDEVPIMPIYTYVNQGMLRESVLGWFENVRDWHPLKYLWLEPVGDEE